MTLFNKLNQPVFLKENSDAERQLENLRGLEPLLNEEGRKILKQDIKRLEYGIAGEKSISFELKNCHMPIYILHDIYVEDGDLNAQIDYLVFTKKICFVIECKNLYGDIEINSAGDFIRTMEFGGKKVKEGIYSPITQNQRHLDLMKKIKIDNKNNIFTKFMAGRYFEDFYKSIVVLANPKTILQDKFAKKEIKEKVIRGDQLVQYIKDTYNNSKELANSAERTLTWAQTFLDLHQSKEFDYMAKYEPYKIEKGVDTYFAEPIVKSDESQIEENALFQELRAYRLKKSREENSKPYFIYNDMQLKDLILKMPLDKEALLRVAGFGAVKVEKYGDDILVIVGKYKYCRTL